LILGLGSAITGCTNAYLNGSYNAQITNIAFENAINAVNATCATGAALPDGLAGNAASINGNVPGRGRFYFDGNGNIMGGCKHLNH
jgi:hypothetical protein